jgi:hypothetical protein
MRTQILKGAGLAVVLGVLTLSAPAPVAAADIRANVPFSFTVDKKVLPAGTYNVTSSSAHSLLISGFDAGTSRWASTRSPRRPRPRLVFHRYGTSTSCAKSGWAEPPATSSARRRANVSWPATAAERTRRPPSFEQVEVAIQ